MTNTDTADADATAIQVAQLAHAGSELVRVTVNNDEAAKAVPVIREKLDRLGVGVPLIGDFHYNGHLLLTKYPAARPRRWPSTASTRATWAPSAATRNFIQIVEVAIANAKPVRIGVNWGTLDQQLLTDLMNANAALPEPRDSRDVMIEAMVESAMRSARLAEETGLGHDRIILQAKVSGVQDLVEVYRPLAEQLRLPPAPGPDRGRHGQPRHHLLDRRPGHPAAAWDRRHHPGQPDARAGRRPHRGGAGRAAGAAVDGPAQLHAPGDACPGCGRTTSTFFQEMARDIRRLPARPDARLARVASGRGGAAGGGHGLRGRTDRARVEARRHRHQPAGHVRGAGGTGLRGRRSCAPPCAGDDIVPRFLEILDDVRGRSGIRPARRRRSRAGSAPIPAAAAPRHLASDGAPTPAVRGRCRRRPVG